MPSAGEFFRELWKDCEGYAELRIIGEGRASPRSFVKQIPKDLDGFLAEAKKQSGKAHVYYGTSLRGTPKPRDPKAKTYRREDVSIVSGIWADVDLFEKQQGVYVPRYQLPYVQLKEKIHEDIKWLTEAIKPTASIWSGGGYQLFWMLREPIVLSGPEDPDGERLEAINHAVGKAVKGDSVYNLDRILRVPGTLNVKAPRCDQPPEEAKDCYVVFLHPDRRYDLDTFEEKLPIEVSLEHIRSKGKKVDVPAAGGPVDLYQLELKPALIPIIEGGLDAYIAYRRKTDTADLFDKRDMSRSGADAFIVTELLKSGVEEQLIWDIYRDPHNGISAKYQEKGDDYLQRTLTNCRPIAEKAKKKKETKEDKDAGKVRIEIEKFKAEKRIYTVKVHLPDGTDAAGKFDIDTVWHYSKFEKAFWDASGRMLPKMSQARWRKLLDKCPKKMVEAPADAKTEESVNATLEDWLDEKVENPDSGTLQVKPGFDSDKLFFRLPALMAQLKRNGLDVKRPELCELLRRQGWDDKKLRARDRQFRGWFKATKASGNGQHTQEELFPKEEKRDTI